uniref:Competence protein ComM n=1 Tax=Pseudomonas aeruginosa TaxID=287 RepID=A0A5E5R3N0_PSEAI|nr:Competence protein ComM [Pseudomonas aeruginosa]
MEAAGERLELSLRALHRILKVARTLADLERIDAIERRHLAEALQYRAMTST